MLDIKAIRENPAPYTACMAARNHESPSIDEVLALDEKRRTLQYEVEQLRAEQNQANERIAQARKTGEDAADAIAAMRELGVKTKAMGEELKALEADLRDKLLRIPNLLDASVPEGADERANREELRWGEPPRFDFEPKDHVEIGEALGILDFERAAKLSGARFSLSKGAGARLERALINFMLDVQTTEHGYTEVLPPFMVKSSTMEGTGQLPKFAEDAFKLDGHDLWLISTAEIPLTNIHREEILDESDLPLYFTAYTPCFRSEAGSYGQDTRGMLRQHQFNKVELVKVTTPEQSWDELETLTANAESILQRLKLPYRKMTLSTGDTGFSAAKTYDLEVWLPGQNAYREISSCSNCTDFQARRANIRFRRGGGKPEFCHTLNGSGLAAGRTFIAILENYQNADGSVTVPDALQPYMGGANRIEREW